MARALIVGCGCRGRELGSRLLADGWQVRGTTREEDRRTAIEAAGLEAAVADPDRPGTVLDQVHDIAVVVWLLGSILGEPELIAAVHGSRLERMLEKLVDTPVRGFVYEGSGGVQSRYLQGGAELVRQASAAWRIPVEVVEGEVADTPPGTAELAAACARVLG